MVTLTAPLFEVLGKSFSGRDLIMLFGGVFLLFKATMELHERLEGHVVQTNGATRHAAFWPIVAQIVVLDAVFSLDAVITAVGMVEHLSVMMIAVIFSIGIMIVASKPLTRFVNAHPTVIMLCLGFDDDRLQPDSRGPGLPHSERLPVRGHRLLVADRAVQPVGACASQAQLATASTLRERTAHAVLRLMGGRRVEADEVGDEIADLVEGGGEQVVFDRRERVMISGVLNLAERPIRTVMTVRVKVDAIDLALPADAIARAGPLALFTSAADP